LEILVHTRSRTALNGRFVVFEAEIPPGLVTEPEEAGQLPRQKTQELGDRWVKKAEYAVLCVPSIVTGEPNYLLNPNHADFSKIRIGDPQVFHFDGRLLG
jgi:RES domain-containing protein